MAASAVSVLMFDELTNDKESVASVQAALDFGVRDALHVLEQATGEAQADVSLILGNGVNPSVSSKRL